MSKHKLRTPKEEAILRLLAKGLMYKENAVIQKININTIKNIVKAYIKN